MKNNQKGSIAFMLLGVIILLVIGGGVYFYKNKKVEAPVVPVEETQPDSAALQSEQKAIAAAKKVLGVLAARDYQKLEALVSSDGLSLSPEPYFDPLKNLIPKAEVSEIPKDKKLYLWGYTDGEGAPINLTRGVFITEYIYDGTISYAKAPDVAVNKTLGSGNSLNTIHNDANGRMYVAFHFPGFNPDYVGMDWTTIYLIFDLADGEYKLRAIAKDNWTI